MENFFRELVSLLYRFFGDDGGSAAHRLVVSCLMLVGGFLVARLVRRWLRIGLGHTRAADTMVVRFFAQAAYVTIIVLVVLAVMDRVGLGGVRTFIGGLGVMGLILGFALREVLSNFAAGLLLFIYRPFRAGQTVEIEGAQGVVEEITIVNMQMITLDGVRVILPNSKVWGAKITNYSLAENRRIELNLKVVKRDIEAAIRTIKSAADQDPRILKTPTPFVKVTGLNDNFASLVVWVWTLPVDFPAVNADVYLRILKAMSKAGLATQ